LEEKDEIIPLSWRSITISLAIQVTINIIFEPAASHANMCNAIKSKTIANNL
jgi:hypothetical protein